MLLYWALLMDFAVMQLVSVVVKKPLLFIDPYSGNLKPEALKAPLELGDFKQVSRV